MENFQVRGDLVEREDGWTLVPHKLVGGFEAPASRVAMLRANAGKALRFRRTAKRELARRRSGFLGLASLDVRGAGSAGRPCPAGVDAIPRPGTDAGLTADAATTHARHPCLDPGPGHLPRDTTDAAAGGPKKPLGPPTPRARSRAWTALISARCVNACG